MRACARVCHHMLGRATKDKGNKVKFQKTKQVKLHLHLEEDMQRRRGNVRNTTELSLAVWQPRASILDWRLRNVWRCGGSSMRWAAASRGEITLHNLSSKLNYTGYAKAMSCPDCLTRFRNVMFRNPREGGFSASPTLTLIGLEDTRTQDNDGSAGSPLLNPCLKHPIQPTLGRRGHGVGWIEEGLSKWLS